MGAWDAIAGAFAGVSGVGDLLDKTKVGGIPMVGTIVNGAKGIAHLGEAGIDALCGDPETAKDHLAQAAMDGVKAIPYVGTAATAAEAVYDFRAGQAEEYVQPDGKIGFRNRPTAAQDVRQWMFGDRQSHSSTEPANDPVSAPAPAPTASPPQPAPPG